MRGIRDPGEGSFDIDYDDENASHDKLAELAETGIELIGILVQATLKHLQLIMPQLKKLICQMIVCGYRLKVM